MSSTVASTADLFQKIQHIRVGMLTTHGEGNTLLSRPMTSQNVDKEGLLWFFTSDQATVAENIQRQADVNVSFTAPGDSLYVSVSGQAEVIKDRSVIRDMWNPMVGAWFPGGPDDPHVALLKVTVSGAEYWDSDKSKMMQLFAMAKAAVTGEPPTSIGEHKKITL